MLDVMGVVNPRAICPNCGAKIHTQGGVIGTATGLGHSTGSVCPQCGVALSGKVGWDNRAKLAGQPSDGGQVLALIGKGISAGGRAIQRRRERNATDAPQKGRDDSTAEFDVVATFTAQALMTIRDQKQRKELQEQQGLTDSEVTGARRQIAEWHVKPDEPSVVAASVPEDMATETKALMEKLGAQVEVVPTEPHVAAEPPTAEPHVAAEPPTDENSESAAGPGPSPEASEDVLPKIEKLGQLHDTGVLTDEEFQAKKSELLQRL